MSENLTEPNDIVFDKLVDGELSETERRELLVGLDDRPGGWRRCALAFLEAQCWRTSLGAFDREPDRDKPQPRETPSKKRWWQAAGTVGAMAASFLLALGFALWARHPRLEPSVAPMMSQQSGEIAKTESAQPQPRSATPTPWRVVTVSNGQQPNDSFNVPAREHENLDPRWLQSVPPAIPDNVMQALSRTGHQVQQRRELMRVTMPDGRRLLVPVDQVEVRYVGNQTY